jgi:hypothetical protein
MKRLLFVLTIALVALSLNSAPVAAQAVGVTDVDITLEGVVILHYFSEVDVTITGSILGGLLTGGSPTIDEGIGTAGAGGMIFDLAIPTTEPAGDISAVVMTLQNAWAVRSIGATAGNTNVAIDATVAPTLTHVGGGVEAIEITAATVSSGGVGPGTDITFPSPGLDIPQDGDVQLTLDMRAATLAGEYANGQFTLTATIL